MATSVYVSYSWTAERENPVIEGLGEACTAYGLDFQRDSTRLKHGDLIRHFMDEIGSSGNIIPVFSRPYFESEYCMYELLQVWRNGNFQQRIHPILVEKIRLDDADLQLELIDYWEKKARALQDKLNQRDLGNTLELQKRRIVCAEIYQNIGDLLEFVSNMSITPLDQLQRGRLGEQIGELWERIGKPSHAESGAWAAAFYSRQLSSDPFIDEELSSIDYEKITDDLKSPEKKIDTSTIQLKQAVEFSAFTLPSIKPASWFMIDVWAYMKGQENFVLAQSASIGNTKKLGFKSGVNISKNTIITVSLELKGFNIEEPIETIEWVGEATNVSFTVEAL